jgi:sugar lactone lactonase YvrE
MKHFLPVVLGALLFCACQKSDVGLKPAANTTENASLSTDDAAIPLSNKLQLVYAIERYQLTGVAISHTGRLFTNFPLWPGPHKYDVVEVTSPNSAVPFPNEEWNSWKPGEDGSNKWVCVQAVYVDDSDYLWVLDPASPYMKGVYKHSYKLVKFNLQTNSIERIYRFNYIADKASYLNDVRVDTATNFAYITNSSEGGIVVLDLATGKKKQVLQGHPSVIASPFYKLTFFGKQLKYDNGQPLRFNSDGIALTPDGKYIYYKPLSDDRLYRIGTKYLRNFALTSEQLSAHVEFMGHFTTTDGMIFDKKGNLYFGDLEHFRIIRIKPDKSIEEVVQDARLIWPDSYSISPDGYLYVSCSQIQLQPEYNLSNVQPPTPYTIYKININE